MMLQILSSKQQLRDSIIAINQTRSQVGDIIRQKCGQTLVGLGLGQK